MKSTIVAVALTFAVMGCTKSEPPAPPAPPPAPAPAKVAPAPKAPPAPAKAVKKPSAYQQTKGMDWKLTPERRAAIEKAIPAAKGFIDGNEIVQEIVAKKIKKADERRAFIHKKVKGKYVLFAAQTNPNPFNNNASLNLIFGEGGLMPDFMMVQLTAPKNFDSKEYAKRYGSGSGYVTAFVGKLTAKKDSVTLDPAFDVFLPGYWK
jgi:hypothetical protein